MFLVPVIAFAIWKARPHAIVLLCVPMALLGIFWLNGARLDGLNSGDALIVFSAGFWALHVLFLGILARNTGLPIGVSALTFLVAGVLALLGALLLESPSLDSIQAGWLEIAYAGIISTAIGFSLQAIGQQYVPPANAAIILSAESLFAAVGGALLLGERLPPIGYVGAALLFLAILLVEAVPALLARREKPA